MSDRASFEIVDVLGGFASLARRSPTLDGSVRVRAAQACTPLLEGNALGAQIVLRDAIRVRRRALGGLDVRVPDDLAARARALAPFLRARGLVAPGSGWDARLGEGLVARARSGITLFTGLFARPSPGVRLRVAGTKNRRSFAYDVREAILDDADGLTPIVLAIDLAADDVTLAGEVATIVPLPARTRLGERAAADGPEVLRAYVDFYDRAYFEAKRAGEAPRKYRSMVARQEGADAPWGEAAIEAVASGPSFVEPALPASIHRAAGPASVDGASPDRLVVKNAVPFSVTWDGLRVAIEPDATALAAFAARVREALGPLLAANAAEPHEGSLLYLTKYFTPHPPGEPHFFVKPPCLVRTPPGVSTWIEGRGGRGHDVLRGVVETDSFHATPAVFELVTPGARVEIPAGAPLAELFALPRSLAASPFTERALSPFDARPPEVSS